MTKVVKSRLMQEFEKRFIVNEETGCWEWNIEKYGHVGDYGRFTGFGIKELAHRLSYKLYVKDPEGLFVLHRCDNRPCVNPDHLFLGTQLENMRDMIAKGRLVVGRRYSGDENVSRRMPEVLARGETHPNVKLTEDNVKYILKVYKPRDPIFGCNALAAQFGVQQAAISKIVNGVTWRHIPR